MLSSSKWIHTVSLEAKHYITSGYEKLNKPLAAHFGGYQTDHKVLFKVSGCIYLISQTARKHHSLLFNTVSINVWVWLQASRAANRASRPET